jgi:hypothetical protein
MPALMAFSAAMPGALLLGAGTSGSGRADGSFWLSFQSRGERPADAAQAAFAAGVWWFLDRIGHPQQSGHPVHEDRANRLSG